MKEKKLTIQIHRPPAEVFAYLLDPKNTPAWVHSIIAEETNEWPPKIGTIYRNQNKEGVWSEYKVVTFTPPTMFELVSMISGYHARYTLRPIDAHATELEYFEWMEEGDLVEPFTIDVLQQLKIILEKS